MGCEGVPAGVEGCFGSRSGYGHGERNRGFFVIEAVLAKEGVKVVDQDCLKLAGRGVVDRWIGEEVGGEISQRCQERCRGLRAENVKMQEGGVDQSV